MDILWPPLIYISAMPDATKKVFGTITVLSKSLVKFVMGFSDVQKEMLSTPTYKLRKEKKSGVLVSPEDVTVIDSVDDREPTFHSSPTSLPASAHAQPQPEASTASFVTSAQLKEISDQWSKQFARFEALLSRGNIFSTPKTAVKPMPAHTELSDTPFFALSTRLTGPVEFSVEGEADDKQISKTNTK